MPQRTRKGKIKPCLLAAANFSTVITAVRKADKVQDAIKTVAVGLPKFRSEVVAARNVVVQAREILDRNAKDLADDFTVNKPDRADCGETAQAGSTSVRATPHTDTAPRP